MAKSAVIKNSKGKELPRYPMLLKHPETGKKVLVKSAEEEEAVLAKFPKQKKDGSWGN